MSPSRSKNRCDLPRHAVTPGHNAAHEGGLNAQFPAPVRGMRRAAEKEDAMNQPIPTNAATQSILIAYDLSETGGLALQRGLAMAHAARAVPHVVHVATPFDDSVRFGDGAEEVVVTWEDAAERLRQAVQTRLVDFAEAYGTPQFAAVYSHLRAGSPAEQIVTLANELRASLIFAGTHGRRGLRRAMLGSVAETLVRTAPCPVLVVRPFQFKSGSVTAPTIEDACPRCIDARHASGGRRLWCDQHSEGFGRRHTYHEVPRNVRRQQNLPLLFPMRG